MNEPGYLVHCSDGTLMHRSHKYIDKIKTSKGWRYIYEKSGAAAREKYRDLSVENDKAQFRKYATSNKANSQNERENYLYKNHSSKYARYATTGKGGEKLADVDKSFIDQYEKDTAGRYNGQAEWFVGAGGDYNNRSDKTWAQKAEGESRNARKAKADMDVAKSKYDKTFLGKVDKAKERGSSYINKLKQKASKKKKK